MRIYVGNLSYDATEDNLRELFSEYGEVADVTVLSDRYTGRSRGFGFVEMPNRDEATAAIEALNEQEHLGRSLRVNEAQPRKNRGSGPRASRYDDNRGSRGRGRGKREDNDDDRW